MKVLSTREKILIPLLLMVVIAGALFWRESINQGEARAVAEKVAKAKQELIDQKDKEARQRDEDYKAQLADLDRRARAVKTVQDARRVIVEHSPEITDKDAVVVPTDTLTKEVQDKLPPDAKEAIILSPKAQMKIAQEQLECDKDRLSLKKCAADLAGKDVQLTAAMQQRDEYQRALEGGTKFERVKKSLASGACAGVGAAVGAMGGKNKATGAAVGAFAGVVACKLFGK
jgi:hypothetical protein